MSVTRAVGTPDEATLERNTYDGNGNKETTTDAEGRVTRFAYDAANRLDEPDRRLRHRRTPRRPTFDYDGVGNLLEERDARAAAPGRALVGRSAPTTT